MQLADLTRVGGVVLLALLTSCGSPYTRSHQGYDVTLKAIERTRSARIGGGQEVTATDGNEILLVRLELVKTASGESQVEIGQFELVCADGSSGETSLRRYGGSFPSGTTPLDVPFGVAKGARPKTLTIGELTFDVEGFPVESSSGR
jgi:hypothetical protein